jgi:hypothetical protein
MGAAERPPPPLLRIPSRRKEPDVEEQRISPEKQQEEDVLGENLQVDVSDVGARGGRATIGESDIAEYGRETARRIARRAARNPDTGTPQPSSRFPPDTSYAGADELEEPAGEMGGYIDEGIEQYNREEEE